MSWGRLPVRAPYTTGLQVACPRLEREDLSQQQVSCARRLARTSYQTAFLNELLTAEGADRDRRARLGMPERQLTEEWDLLVELRRAGFLIERQDDGSFGPLRIVAFDPPAAALFEAVEFSPMRHQAPRRFYPERAEYGELDLLAIRELAARMGAEAVDAAVILCPSWEGTLEDLAGAAVRRSTTAD